jgi:hypothetical protein
MSDHRKLLASRRTPIGPVLKCLLVNLREMSVWSWEFQNENKMFSLLPGDRLQEVSLEVMFRIQFKIVSDVPSGDAKRKVRDDNRDKTYDLYWDLRAGTRVLVFLLLKSPGDQTLVSRRFTSGTLARCSPVMQGF